MMIFVCLGIVVSSFLVYLCCGLWNRFFVCFFFMIWLWCIIEIVWLILCMMVRLCEMNR